jgi:tetratricopeptide (TPR) repeat protein
LETIAKSIAPVNSCRVTRSREHQGDRTSDADDGEWIPLLVALARRLDHLEGPQGWIPALHFGVAGALSEAGEHDPAAKAYRRLVDVNPGHAWAWIGLIDTAMARGAADDAVACARAARHHLPDDVVLWRRTAMAIEGAKGHAAAAAFCRETADIDLGPDDLRYAIGLHRSAQDVAAAASFYDRLLARDPHDPLGQIARIEAALQTDRIEEAVIAARAALSAEPEDPELRLRIAQALCRANAATDAVAVLDNISGASHLADQVEACRADCLRQLVDADTVPDRATDELGDAPEPTAAGPAFPRDPYVRLKGLDQAVTGGSAKAVEDELRRLFGSPTVAWYVALSAVERALHVVPPGAVDDLAAALAEAQWTVEERQAFEIERRLLCVGPRASLDWIRANATARREQEAAERLGRVLLAAGGAPLAARYLRACCRRWPGAPALIELAGRAHVAAGLLLEIRDPEGPDAAVSRDARHAARVLMALSDGDLAQARTLRDMSDTGDGPRLAPATRIEIDLLSGRLDLAEAAVSRLSIADGPFEEALICRPRATRLGTMLNETRILAASGIDWVSDKAETLRAFADGFFLPARTLLDRREVSGATGVSRGPVIPDRFHLVLPDGDIAQGEAERLIEACQRATRRTVSCHLLSHGAELLADVAGTDAARAFRMTRDPEQQADLMMLAAVQKGGGLVVRAPQWPGSGIDRLFDSHRSGVMFREGDGSLSCDAMAFADGHALPGLALGMAITSCLSNENDHRWFKTGPGLLTRAFVRLEATAQAPQEAQAATLLPAQRLRKVLYPYAAAARHRLAGPARRRPLRAGAGTTDVVADPSTPSHVPTG